MPLRALRMLKNTLAFLTIIPVGMDEHVFEDSAKLMWLFPAYGALIGLIGGGVGLCLTLVGLPQLATASIIYAVLLWITGFNHMDGLLDYADAMAVPASRERRLQIMKDKYKGAAAVAVGVIVAALTIALLSSTPTGGLLQATVVAEASAKLGMVLTAWIGPAARSGLGEMFVEELRRSPRLLKLVAPVAMCCALSLLMGFVGLIMVLASALTSTAITASARRALGGVTGDVIGASNELSRAVSLASCVVALNWGLQAWLWLGVGV
ncbi:MAG: adenosylcobinamide-GDP ribazoletransferase [Thermoprotei archaeon]|nr:MAG: adenosylcobinamide-GDP ribazoletransferase [Thermoprotei archaeon]